MHIRHLTTVEQLVALREPWRPLDGGVPFRSWDWLATWWQHYGGGQKVQLHTLACYAGDTLVAVAPWYRQRMPLGWVIRALGDGEICSDYLGIPCLPGHESAVAATLAEHLTSADSDGSWDLVRLGAQDVTDPVLRALGESLRARGHAVTALPGPRCWRIDLPAPTPSLTAPADDVARQWTAYLDTLSSSHRRQTRRCERRCSALGGKLHVVRSAAELGPAFAILVELHQRRREQQGERGFFSAPQVLAFHHDVAARLLETKRLWLAWLELQGRPIAAYYGPRSAETLYVYQSGIEPTALALEPGRMMLVQTLRYALAQGIRSCDLLRGDEPYKSHFRALPRPSHDLLIAHRHFGGQLSYHALTKGRRLRSWMREVRTFLHDRLRPSPG